MSSLIGNRYGEAFFEAGRMKTAWTACMTMSACSGVCSVKMRIS